MNWYNFIWAAHVKPAQKVAAMVLHYQEGEEEEEVEAEVLHMHHHFLHVAPVVEAETGSVHQTCRSNVIHEQPQSSKPLLILAKPLKRCLNPLQVILKAWLNLHFLKILVIPPSRTNAFLHLIKTMANIDPINDKNDNQ